MSSLITFLSSVLCCNHCLDCTLLASLDISSLSNSIAAEAYIVFIGYISADCSEILSVA